jgi:hypothetical protein
LKKDQYRRRIITPHQNFITILKKFQVPITQWHIHPEHTQEMTPMNNLENKHRKQRIELANNLTLAAVTVTAIVNTIAVILKIAR